MRELLFWDRILLGAMLWIQSSTSVMSQSWDCVNFPLLSSNVTMLYADTSNDQMLALGELFVAQGPDTVVYAALRYSSGNWDTLAIADAPILCALRHHDTLIVGGAFMELEGTSSPCIGYLNGGAWSSFGVFNGPVRKLLSWNDSLVAVGSFTECDGIACTGACIRSNGQWTPLGLIPSVSPVSINDAVIGSDGMLYACGLIRTTAYKDAVVFDGTNWNGIGAGILGSISAGYAIAEYAGDIIVAGTIDIGAGNPGHAVMGWNGNNYYPLNIGPQYLNGSYQYLYRVNVLTNYSTRLVAGGGFNFVDGLPSSKVAQWDGTHWCAQGGSIDGEIRAMCIYHDSLFVATVGADSFDGQACSRIAKYAYNPLFNDCSTSTLSIDGPQTVDDRITIFINTCEIPFREIMAYPGETLIHVYDMSARCVLMFEQSIFANQTLDLCMLRAGIYTVQLYNAERNIAVGYRLIVNNH